MRGLHVETCYADPAGNITLLTETAFSPDEYPAIAGRLLLAEPSAEQVGFIENISRKEVSLRMAGGEFCGNAAFSAAAMAIWKTGSDEGTVLVDFAGTGSLSASVSRVSENSYTGRIQMPLPEEVSEKHLCFEGKDLFLPVVRFPGITHILCTAPMDRTFAEAAVKQWCAELAAPAAGIMLLDEEHRALTPLVYVPRPETLFWESSCASGTCAAAFWLSSRSGTPSAYRFSEPGGTLGAETGQNSIHLLNTVRLERRSYAV